MAVVDGSRKLEIYGRVGILRIIFGIHVESACLAVCSLFNTNINDFLMLEHIVSPTMLFFLIDCCQYTKKGLYKQ